MQSQTWPVWLLAARVDLRLGKVIERWHSPEQGEAAANEDDILHKAIEMLRSWQRPKEVILFAEPQIHLYQRSANSADVGTVVVGKRHNNLERLLAVMRHVSRTVDI